MNGIRRPLFAETALFAAGFLAALVGCGTRAEAPRGSGAPYEPPTFDGAFWERWGDGQAELAGYEFEMTRYGEVRRGTAVAIFVTETFSNELRVKADPGKHPPEDEVPVMKLNLVEDFPTGVYDYNWMTSAFIALKAVNGRPAGAPMKISFTSQEWCGHSYSHALFDADSIRHVLHSYFDGEADQSGRLPYPADGLAEDALWFWARGFSGPVLEPGESASVRLLPALKRRRKRSDDAGWVEAALSRAAQPETITVPAGEFVVERWTAAPADGPTRTFFVEAAEPRRVIQWETDDGETARLLGGDRMPYWKMNGPEYLDSLSRLGLSPRPPRTP